MIHPIFFFFLKAFKLLDTTLTEYQDEENSFPIKKLGTEYLVYINLFCNFTDI